MSIEALCEAARQRIAPTRKERLALAAERSKVFNERCRKDFESQRMTPELLRKTIDLGMKEQ